MAAGAGARPAPAVNDTRVGAVVDNFAELYPAARACGAGSHFWPLASLLRAKGLPVFGGQFADLSGREFT